MPEQTNVLEPIKQLPLEQRAPVYAKEQERIAKEIPSAEADIERETIARDTAVKEAAAKKSQELTAEQGMELAAGTAKINQYKLPEFRPSQEDLTSYAQLGSTIATLGLLLGGGGKMTSKAALASMTGMLNGWRQGRNELYEKELRNFEKETQRMTALRKDLQADLDRAMKLWPTKRADAIALAESAAYKAGSQSIFAAKIKSGDLKGAMALLESARKTDEKMQELKVRQEEKTRVAAATAAYRQQSLALQRQRIEQQAARGGGGRPPGQLALNFASRVYSNILNASTDLKNMTLLPKTAESPLLSGMINTEPSTALGSIKAFVGRKMTSADARAFDQVTNSLDAALARLEGQGLASGSTQSAIKSFNVLKPKAGDPAINMAMYVARVKQEIETGIRVHKEMPGATEGQKSEAQKELQEINKIIPFSINDVLSVARQGKETLNQKMINLVQKPTIAQSIQYQGLSPLDADSPKQGNVLDLREKAAARIAAGGDPNLVAQRFKELTGEDF